MGSMLGRSTIQRSESQNMRSMNIRRNSFLWEIAKLQRALELTSLNVFKTEIDRLLVCG